MPSIVPLMIASMLDSNFSPGSSALSSSRLSSALPGTINFATSNAAGREISDAEIMWPTASGTVRDRVVA